MKKRDSLDKVFALDKWKFFGLLLFACAGFWLIPSEQRGPVMQTCITIIVGGGSYYLGKKAR